MWKDEPMTSIPNVKLAGPIGGVRVIATPTIVIDVPLSPGANLSEN